MLWWVKIRKKKMWMGHRFGSSYMLTEARESGADDVSTWSTYVYALRAPLDLTHLRNRQLRQLLGDCPLTIRISVTALNLEYEYMSTYRKKRKQCGCPSSRVDHTNITDAGCLLFASRPPWSPPCRPRRSSSRIPCQSPRCRWRGREWSRRSLTSASISKEKKKHKTPISWGSYHEQPSSHH